MDIYRALNYIIVLLGSITSYIYSSQRYLCSCKTQNTTHKRRENERGNYPMETGTRVRVKLKDGSNLDLYQKKEKRGPQEEIKRTSGIEPKDTMRNGYQSL